MIHYCWFGKGDKPIISIKCIESWKKHLPDYKIIEWNEDNFDINVNEYVKQAYSAKKYAFVTDYVRLHVLLQHGGIYMDTDVEVLKKIDVFLDTAAFSGFESNEFIPTGIMGCIKGHTWVERLLNYYSDRSFINNDGTLNLIPNTKAITDITKSEYGLKPGNYTQILKDGINIYPSEYFCPKDWMTKELHVTENTYTIHHFSGSWIPKSTLILKIKERIARGFIIFFGERNYNKLRRVVK